MSESTRRDELVPLADRMAVLQTVRLLIATAVIVIAAVMGDPRQRVLPIAASYVAVTAILEIIRRVAGRRGLRTLSATFLLDGVFLAIAVSLTGGYDSPMLFLVFLQVMAVTLLVSYRTGLKVAVWYVLLLFAGHAAAEAEVAGIDSPGSDREAALSALAFLIFAIGAAAFSSINERALRRSRADLRSLVELGAALERAGDTTEVMDALARHGLRLGYQRVAALVERQGTWRGAVADERGIVRIETAGEAGLRVAHTMAGRQPQLVKELDEGIADVVLPNARNVVLIPLVAEGEELGVVVGEWGHRLGAHIPAATVDSLEQSAGRTALALRDAWQVAEIERLATRDGLTGLANRRLFEESLEREVARARRRSTPLSLVVLDVDHFKDINDTFGHPAGDAVLREVGDALTSKSKDSDLAARYGGDEFVILLPDCNAENALVVAERLRTAVQEHATTLTVTTSAGTASLPDNAGDAGRLVAAADAALYQAKRDGRDRSVASSRRPFRAAADAMSASDRAEQAQHAAHESA